jgi:hypothetical protein
LRTGRPNPQEPPADRPAGAAADPFAPSGREARLALARAYPYPAPADAFTWRAGRVEPFDPALRQGRTPVLAVGSNRSPLQLDRKYRGWPDATRIAVEPVQVRDVDVVYSAHITRYGALPGLMADCPGTRARLAVLWLDAAQLERMHETEGVETYAYAPLADGRASDLAGRPVAGVHAYFGRRGAFAPDGTPLALAAVEARGRIWPAQEQAAALDRARREAAPTLTLDDFIDRAATDPGARRRYTDRLAGFARPTGLPS